MNHSIKIGFSFGLTSGIITTLGLMMGLNSGTHLKLAVIGGILTIAVADAFSDALGIHISEESENKHSGEEVWEATISTFTFKFISALTFVIPVLFFQLPVAITVNIIWGLLLLIILSFSIAKEQKVKPWKFITEHLLITIIVITVSNYLGKWIAAVFS